MTHPMYSNAVELDRFRLASQQTTRLLLILSRARVATPEDAKAVDREIALATVYAVERGKVYAAAALKELRGAYLHFDRNIADADALLKATGADNPSNARVVDLRKLCVLNKESIQDWIGREFGIPLWAPPHTWEGYAEAYSSAVFDSPLIGLPEWLHQAIVGNAVVQPRAIRDGTGRVITVSKECATAN